MRIETQYSSPNHSERGDHAIRLLVLHATVGSFHSSLSWLCSPSSRVSSHYLISKTGRVLRLVSEERAAWHAGRASWHGELDVNEISIGVELENANTGKDPYPPAQMQALTELVLDIKSRYPRIELTRHMDVAVPKGRKTDPAGFPWEQWRSGFDVPTMPPPVFLPKHTYRAIGIPVYQRSDRTGPLWGYLQTGDVVEIDDRSNGHLADGRGFVHLEGLSEVTQ